MKNFDLDIENELFLNLNFVFTIMIYHIFNEFFNYNSENWQWGVGLLNTLCRFN